MLELTDMTLRGVGSYIKGSRLEFRPLTILSGINGSGKSTWFKSLAMIQRSLTRRLQNPDSERFPFAFHVDDQLAYDVNFMNYPLYCSSDLSTLQDNHELDQFGPPACVGLQFVARHAIGLPARGNLTATSAATPEERFLLLGECPQGMRIRVRLAHPTNNSDEHLLPTTAGAFHYVELKVGGAVFVLQKPHSPRGGNDLAEDYTFHCSPPMSASLPEEDLPRLVGDRICDVLKEFFESYFYISAIRDLDPDETDSRPGMLFNIRNNSHFDRDVTPRGEDAWRVFKRNSTTSHFTGGSVEASVRHSLSEILGVDMDDEVEDGYLGRLRNRFLPGPQVPRQFSSGFHQLFPIIVQLAVMNEREILCLENPEVHLHPDLQLRIAKHLLDTARTGRKICVETHSDLIIRRVVRAILDEESGVSQQMVALYFADVETVTDVGDGSVLKPFGVDDGGRIVWPPGFMDESIAESERLMNVMYGRRLVRQDDNE
jgi:energy-coupling factor transporter ATP-binding protein EcfA2